MRHKLFCTRALSSLSSSSSSSSSLSWKQTGNPQRTLAAEVSLSGTTLHSGARTTAKLAPAMAGEGRYFVVRDGRERARIPATAENAEESPLCTTLRKDGAVVRTVEHLLSAMEAAGVDNAEIEVDGGHEVPILDGSAREWVKAINQVGLSIAKDGNNNSMDRMAAIVHKPVCIQRNESLVAAFPSPKIQITCGIDFSKVPAIGCQWFSCSPMDDCYYKEIASSRTFCIYEEVEKLRSSGLIQGGSLENAIVCSVGKGWLNPPLRFHDEPCRHKVLDLVGDLSLLACDGNQGLPLAHVFAYKVVFIKYRTTIWGSVTHLLGSLSTSEFHFSLYRDYASN